MACSSATRRARPSRLGRVIVAGDRRRPLHRDRRSNRRLAVLISGRGSNLQSIIDAIAARPARRRRSPSSSRTGRDAPGLDARPRGRHRGACVSVRATIADRDAYDRAIVDVLRRARRRPRLPRRLHAARRRAAPRRVSQHRILNIHPSLLPAFPGLDAQRQALEHGVRVTGATVHLVTTELDDGPIVLQARGAGAATTTRSRRCRRGFSSRSIGSIPRPSGSCSMAAGIDRRPAVRSGGQLAAGA